MRGSNRVEDCMLRSGGNRHAYPVANFASAIAQVNGLGAKPYRGWSTFSEQPSSLQHGDESAEHLAQSDAMRSSGLGAHGFQYINLDAGWSGDSDAYGRTLWNTTEFPDFWGRFSTSMPNGQKVGIYLLPGLARGRTPRICLIYGTSYHAQDIVALPLN